MGMFVERVQSSREAQDTVRAMLALRGVQVGGWRGLVAVPPGSPVDGIVQAFHAGTDIPLEVPFFALMHFVSGMLLARKTRIVGRACDCYADLWTVVLAPSGAGKTFAHDVLAEAAPVRSDFPECNSGARFIEALRSHNFSLWFQDEIAQKLRQIETPASPLADVKEYLLRAYSYARIERATKRETITVERPCLGILGLNTAESFLRALSVESLSDGFAQRFALVIADRDPARPMAAFPLYNRDALLEAARKAFAALEQVPIPEAYRVGLEAEAAFRAAFALLADSATVPASFYRRLMFRAFRYAAIYHLLLGKGAPQLDAADIGWGARASTLHLHDMARILSGTEVGEVAGLVRKAQRLQSRSAGRLTARQVRQKVWGCREQATAEAVLAVLGDGGPG